MKNEFAQTNELLKNCLATMVCGCSMTWDEELDALTTYRLAKEYAEAYRQRKLQIMI